jgi:hypothetical protein
MGNDIKNENDMPKRIEPREIPAGATICRHLVEPYDCCLCFPRDVKQTVSAHPETREQGWLVENTNPGPTRWLSVVEGILHWTTDSNAAVRFSRKEDAQQVASLNRFNDTAIATEHIWYS